MTANALTLPDEALRERLRQEFCPRWRVLLHNDDVNTMDHVVYALTQAVPGMSAEQAIQIMLAAHLNEQAVVTVCPRETAEYYRDRIASFNLQSTIEPDDA